MAISPEDLKQLQARGDESAKVAITHKLLNCPCVFTDLDAARKAVYWGTHYNKPCKIFQGATAYMVVELADAVKLEAAGFVAVS